MTSFYILHFLPRFCGSPLFLAVKADFYYFTQSNVFTQNKFHKNLNKLKTRLYINMKAIVPAMNTT